MSTAGRPTKFEPEFCQQAKLLCKLGATNDDMAEFFGVHVSTFHDWRKANPELDEAIKLGRIVADSKVADSLYKRARGYRHKAIKHFIHEGCVIAEEYIEHYPPDTAACIFWLKNRRPDLWQDKKEVTNSAVEKAEKISTEDRIRLIAASRENKKA